jgi:hypothetical protein
MLSEAKHLGLFSWAITKRNKSEILPFAQNDK